MYGGLVLVVLFVGLLLALPLFAISARVTRREREDALRRERETREEIDRDELEKGARR